ncbi:paeninodin family lasso peptide [Neobacillus vireti]|uniref:paeninodin family lasso peptide n=1 Tax=Neobacillus vireti TaxID=220686 RepID=UPI002FFF993B
MKKVWQSPSLEVLDVNMTMGGTNYEDFDADFVEDTKIPKDDKGNPLIGKS